MVYYPTVMNFQRIIHSLRRYSLREIAKYAWSLPKRKAVSRRLAASLDATARPQPGITVVGRLSGSNSLSKTMRDFVTRLRGCGIPCQAFDTNINKRIAASEYEHLLTPASEFRINRYTDIVGMFSLPPLPETHCRLSRIGFWEFETGLLACDPEFYEPIEVVTMSDFARDVFRRQVAPTIPVSKILYPFAFTPTRLIAPDEIRAKYKIPKDAFVVFYNFDYRSSYYRKNPEGALRAFAEAFADRADARIVFKTMNTKSCATYAARLHALAASLGIADRVAFVDDYLLQDELVSLTNACDVYLSLHRGEGFGLGIAEAMSLGKPVVVTNYSAPTEFCNADNALLVPYEMTHVRNDELDTDIYTHVESWANADVHAAAAALRRLYDDRAFAKQLGENGRRFIADYFSDASFKRSIEAFLTRG